MTNEADDNNGTVLMWAASESDPLMAIADLQPIDMAALSSQPPPQHTPRNRRAPITIDGQPFSREPDPNAFNIGTKLLPRKLKKGLRKWAAGRPLSRAERARGWRIRLSDSGERVTVKPEVPDE